jgi:hypothetical protein
MMDELMRITTSYFDAENIGDDHDAIAHEGRRYLKASKRLLANVLA